MGSLGRFGPSFRPHCLLAAEDTDLDGFIHFTPIPLRRGGERPGSRPVSPESTLQPPGPGATSLSAAWGHRDVVSLGPGED